MNIMSAVAQSLIFAVIFGAIMFFAVERQRDKAYAGTAAFRQALVAALVFFGITLIAQATGYA